MQSTESLELQKVLDAPLLRPHKYRAIEGLTEDIVRMISKDKDEPEWMLNLRLKALKFYINKPNPEWGPSLVGLDLDNITYFVKPDAKSNANSWDDVPQEIKSVYDKLGIPEAEKKSLAGVGAQFESQVVYHSLKKEWEDKGVIFLDMDVALKEHEGLVKEYFSKCVPYTLHKYSALHYAVWSGGTFIFVPKGVEVHLPLQAYFRMNSLKMGQFEHTLIIVEENAKLQYIEGCSAPQYNASSIHAGCVEVFVKKNARARYSSVENWSRNTYNLNTKSALVDDNGIIEWVGGNLGSGVTMLYPSSILRGRGSKSDHISIAFASKMQNQDVGAKVFMLAPNTSATITSKSISMEGGITSYRGIVKVAKNAKNATLNVECDALMMDNHSESNTYPVMDIQNNTATISHEATVGRISDEQIFYLMSRGIGEEQAVQMIVSGFIEPVIKELPLEYAVELNRLIALEMEGSLG
ncbi:MAG: Fe-S cluster assembly protein SufB [Candidatus Woesearchaeota archaeon]